MSNSVRTTEGKYLVALLRSALRNEPPAPVPSDLNWNRLFAVAQRHKVEATVFRVVEGLGAPPELLKRWRGFADNALRCELLYDAERATLYDAFDREGFDYLPLKGILLKDLYPHKGMRQFGDNDILFRKKQKRAMKRLMRELGYQCESYSNFSMHDVYFKPPIFCFEMHHALFDRSRNNDYFRAVWSRAVKGERNHEYRMTSEDFYLFTLAHFYKHYYLGGAGFRFFADHYLLLHQFSFDRAEVDRILYELKLKKFDLKMCEIAESFFGDSPREIDEETFEFILTSGLHGTLEHAAQTQVKEGKGIFRYIFLPYKEMEARFSILKYLPFLLPFFWIYRFFRALFNRNKVKQALLVAKYSNMKKA